MRDSEKVYSKEELLNYLYKYGNIPVILFAKDKEGKYVYASENPEKINWIDAGEENSILGKKNQVCENGEIYQEVQLSEDNNWQYTWKDLSSKYQWEAIEKKKIKGYIVSVSKQDSSVVIKNIYWGDDYYEETTAKKPTTTEKKSKKQFTKKTIKETQEKLPQTGQLWWPLPFLAAGGLLCIGIGMIKQKRENDEKE